MFKSPINQHNREIKKRGLQEANKILSDRLDACFTTEYETLRSQALKNGVPVDKVDEVIQRIKLDTQVALIKQFKRELAIALKEKAETSSHTPRQNGQS